MLRLLAAMLKIALASLLLGAALSFFGITTKSLLSFAGLTPEDIWLFVEKAIGWAIPNMVLGSLIIIPIWLLTYIFLPPRND
ncbi:DUF6460 domain-containing protein [Rhizobium sp. LjRoot30]|uniref:DUF6460 domain-containing protein n=1 Tax=Rhizobium sp. LjRoot30 TaxID=3342320 RepID=UPI003ED08AC0